MKPCDYPFKIQSTPMKFTSDKILDFYKSLDPPKVPNNIQMMIPYQSEPTWNVVKQFYQKYYQDTDRRLFLIGINPGRFGGGITGIPFTDPIHLEHNCAIPNPFDKKAELSARFMYKMIEAFGGIHEFYSKVYFTAVSPIGFVSEGKNLNYYDSNELITHWKPSIMSWMSHQLESFGVKRVGIIIGKGKNQKFIEKLNQELNLFGELITLPHPRWVMQYKLRSIEQYIQLYIDTINVELGKSR